MLLERLDYCAMPRTFGLQIAVNDADSVRRGERIGNGLGDRQCLIQGQRAPLEAGRQRQALQPLHDDEVDAAVAADVVSGADVTMVERRDRLRFTMESRPGSRMQRQIRCEDLKRARSGYSEPEGVG